MKKMKKILLFLAGFFLLNTSVISAQEIKTLDDAVFDMSRYLSNRIPSRSKVAVLTFQSNQTALSDYVNEQLIAALGKNPMLTVAPKRDINAAQQEVNFKPDAETTTGIAQAVGRRLGADAAVFGSVLPYGSAYRLRVYAILVQTGQERWSNTYNLQNDRVLTNLTKSAASADPARPGLYAGSAYQGLMDLYNALDWITLNAQNNGVYSIVLEQDAAIAYTVLNYNSKQVTISLKAAGGPRKITCEVRNPAYPLFTVGAGVTFTLEDGVVLSGAGVSQNNSKNLVRVAGGTFIINGGTVCDNRTTGVYVENGTFIINNGTVSGNSAINGGGVYLKSGVFTMNNGVISGNSASNGGGVYLDGGAFTMNNGIISGNSASSLGGGGVYVNASGTFIKSGAGGVIYGHNAPIGDANKASYGAAVYADGKERNTTARITTVIDSRQRGPAGGWE